MFKSFIAFKASSNGLSYCFAIRLISQLIQTIIENSEGLVLGESLKESFSTASRKIITSYVQFLQGLGFL